MDIGSKTLIHDRSAGSRQISRRACLPLIASAVLSPAALIPAQAQGERWQLYRHDDAGFEIEMPGEPNIWPVVENDRKDENWIRRIEAHLDHEKILFGIDYVEYRTVPPMDFLSRWLHEHVWQIGGRKVTRETPLSIYGVPAAEFVSEFDRSMSIARVVIIKNGIIKVDIHGDKGVSSSPLVRRFFDSFKLLPAK